MRPYSQQSVSHKVTVLKVKQVGCVAGWPSMPRQARGRLLIECWHRNASGLTPDWSCNFDAGFCVLGYGSTETRADGRTRNSGIDRGNSPGEGRRSRGLGRALSRVRSGYIPLLPKGFANPGRRGRRDDGCVCEGTRETRPIRPVEAIFLVAIQSGRELLLGLAAPEKDPAGQGNGRCG